MINIVGMSTNPNQSMKKVFGIFMFQLSDFDMARCIFQTNLSPSQSRKTICNRMILTMR